VNFDGYADVFVLTNWGATGNQSGCIWLYDPESGHFEYSKEFSELATFTLNPSTKTIITHGNGGMAGTIFRAAKYVIENNRPVPIITVAQDFDFPTKEYHCVVQRRGRDKALVTIRDVRVKAKENYDGPCAPADPFRDVEDK
jgi:hypothetical protein